MSIALFQEFIDDRYAGVQSRAADDLGVHRSLVTRILAGDRGITPAMAEKIETLSGGKFKKERFIWPEDLAA